jgi:Do/DeqQ family serine protease
VTRAKNIFGLLLKATVIGLAAAFIAVWFKPSLLGAARPSAPAAPVVAAAPTMPPPVAAANLAQPLGSFADAVARSAPAVVNIYAARVVTERTQPAPLAELFGDYWPSYRQRVERSLGSGVLVNGNGLIVTNHHVIAGADAINVQLADGRVAPAKLIGKDPDTDLAVLKLSLGKLPVMPLGRSDRLRVGDIVLAIGNPYGLSQTVTQGIVSATGRGQLGLATFENFIQTDAAINLGNSGGALVNSAGELVGINTAVLNRSSGGPEGIGFAIPVNLVRGVMDQIVKHGRVIRGWLGLVPQDLTDEQAAELGLQSAAGNVLVVNILVDSPAFRAGIRPGDIIARIDGKAVENAQSAVTRIAAERPGTAVEIEGFRAGQPFKLRTTIIERPARET